MGGMFEIEDTSRIWITYSTVYVCKIYTYLIMPIVQFNWKQIKAFFKYASCKQLAKCIADYQKQYIP